MSDTEKERLKKILDDTHEWPSVFLYKFILQGDNKKIAQLESLFGDAAHISTKESSTGKYISISVRVMTMSADEVLDVYAKARKIEGVIVI